MSYPTEIEGLLAQAEAEATGASGIPASQVRAVFKALKTARSLSG